ncbi:hypothetical protein HaLaN_05939 [Haematococcus lacustris]|uniref:Uncharacterized protein n=1 Tax=Haematococcus lacustris TaxID=44745 RepID=A0A699YS72_HAELA|nr:hypothetical protein HaLaN_05939 [Haematococcus lacustris]
MVAAGVDFTFRNLICVGWVDDPSLYRLATITSSRLHYYTKSAHIGAAVSRQADVDHGGSRGAVQC